MRLIVNGVEQEVVAATLAAAMAALDYAEAKVATALNGEFVPARSREATPLKDGDRIEIVAPRQARADLSDDPQGDAFRAAGAWTHRRVEAPRRSDPARRHRRPHRRAGELCLGADVVSVVTDITLNADPEGRAREWIGATRP